MKNFMQLPATLFFLVLGSHCALAWQDNWMSWPSTYTHDPQGVRVDQFAMPAQPIGPDRSSFQRSGFRHYRSTLQVGQSADNYHVVEQYGAPIAPYEQWRFPFRPYGVPFDAWGPATPWSMVNATGFFPGFFPQQPWPAQPLPNQPLPNQPLPNQPGMGGQVMPPGGQPWGQPPGQYWGQQQMQPNYPFGFPLQPNYQNQPWFDGTYPDAPPLDNRSDQQFFWNPPASR